MGSVLTVAEHRGGTVSEISYELVSLGRELAASLDVDLEVVVIGAGSDGIVEDINREGVDRILVVDTDADGGTEYNHQRYLNSITAMFETVDPAVLVMPHSSTGYDYSPAVASRLDLPLLSDITAVAVEDRLTVTRKVYESKVEATIEVPNGPVALTARQGEWPPTTGAGVAEIEVVDIEVETAPDRYRPLEVVDRDQSDISIAGAEFIISIGRGIEEEENLEMIEELCDALGATLGASRPLVELGWLPKDRQVGQSGHVVSPRVYIAIGISGAIEHIVGMKNSDTIIAINNDPDAPIFDVADYGIVGDLFDIVPALIEMAN